MSSMAAAMVAAIPHGLIGPGTAKSGGSRY